MSKTEIVANIEKITPQAAAHLLASMPRNRQVRGSLVERYAREMRQNKWLLNGEPIIIDKNGTLRDGQHRMQAVIASKMTVPMLVVRGVEPESMDTIDTGASRSYADVLVLNGQSGLGQSRLTAAVARWWYLYDNTTTLYAKTSIAHQELNEVLAKHPGIPASVQYIAKHKTLKRNFVPSVIGFVHAYASEHEDRDLANLFVDTLDSGAGLREDDPIYLFRRRMLDMDGNSRLPTRTVLAYTIKVWNSWINGEKLRQLTFREDGPHAESFPRIGQRSKDAIRTMVARRAKQAVRV